MEEWKKNVMEIVEGALMKINDNAKKSRQEIAEKDGEEISGPQVGFLEIEALAEPTAKVLEALRLLMYESATMEAFDVNYKYLMESLQELYDTSEFEEDTPFPTV